MYPRPWSGVLIKQSMKKVISIIFLSMFSTALISQTAIRGKLFDKETGEPLMFANVGLKGTSIGTMTDFDGNFSLESSILATGLYNVQISFISYQTIVIEGVSVTSGQVTLLGGISMQSTSEQLQEVVVSAEAVKTSETAMLVMKKKSAVMLDGISSEEMKLIGDGTAGEAAKRITGVTVEGGKYVYIRGLGDRYTKSTLNGLDIPGLDPDRNTLQMDIFPSSLIDNITISKNFTADLPADFTGGLLNVEIKDLPEKKIFNVTAGVGYNPNMHFNSDYLSYKGGSTDFLGFDDGTRALPKGAESVSIPSPVNGASSSEVNSFIKSFNPTLGGSRNNSLSDFDFGITYGNQISLKKSEETGLGQSKDPKLGYIFSLTYKTDYKFYDEVTFGEYQRVSDSKVNELIYANNQTGQYGERNILIGALAGVAYKTNYSKIRLSIMHLQNGESRAGKFDLLNSPEAVGQSGFVAVSDNLEYNQRSLTNLLLNGNNVFKQTGWDLDWRVSPTFSSSEDPDIRKTAWSITPNNDTLFNAGAGGNPTRIWRSLSELNATAKVDVARKYIINGRDAKLKFGLSHTYKFRDYEILFFDMQFFGRQPNWTSSDPNKILDPANLFPDGTVYYQSGNNDPNPNEYQSNVNNTGIYISNEWKVVSRLTAIVGIRAENFVQRHTGRDIAFANGNTNGKNLENEIVLQSFDLFPSLNTIFNLNDEQNLRLAYSKTVARPSFKELSFAQILDPMTNRIFNGSLFTYSDWDGELVQTRIDNIDFRWEKFMKNDQMISASVFYKQFDKPIELVRIPEAQTSTEYQARNVGDGNLVGLEFELRKSLDFISSILRNYKLSGNVTLVQSQIEMADKEFNARKKFEREGETVKNTREMAGQSPYVINAGFIYSNLAMGLGAGIFYNMKGPTLFLVGSGLYPDVYTEPFHSLNFSMNKNFGKKRNISLELKIVNLLDDRIESFFQSYNAEEQIFSSINPGRTFSFGVSYAF